MYAPIPKQNITRNAYVCVKKNKQPLVLIMLYALKEATVQAAKAVRTDCLKGVRRGFQRNAPANPEQCPGRSVWFVLVVKSQI